ncbi:RHS repeat-associated core domain-containing protein [Brenneria sp. L4-2C]|uniref:RHS repeat domain-containing protein n=1 Tax=unclassified Brenneria TaxID=2634434 RepID=UPI0032F0482A
MARVDSVGESSEVYWYHTELNGLPERMTDEHGNLVWQGQFSTWGEIRSESTPLALETPQNLRYQGQYLDRKTGLHYNLFRYYDPQCGRFTQPDPIGLMGGLNLYQYATNALDWVDPWGLSCSTDAKILGDNLGNRPTVNYRAHHMVMSNSKDVRMRWLRRKMDNWGLDINDAKNGVWLPKNSNSRLPNTKATAHGGEGVHGNAYKQHVWETLKGVKTKEDFETGLASIKTALENGITFPMAQ